MDCPNDPPSGLPPAFASLIRSDFWFLDGNIIIIAGQAAFKVHRGQLERHSEVFDGLFSVPQPHGQELFDGCVYVELQDSPSDVFYFLSALYDGLCVYPLPVVRMVADYYTGTSRHPERMTLWLLLPFSVSLPNTSWSISDNVVYIA